MWSDRKPWWSKKSKENQTNNSHYKNWCVIKIAVRIRHDPSQWNPVYDFGYKAVARENAPTIYTAEGKLTQAIEVDNLTKHEAHCVAKGLNFLDKE